MALTLEFYIFLNITLFAEVFEWDWSVRNIQNKRSHKFWVSDAQRIGWGPSFVHRHLFRVILSRSRFLGRISGHFVSSKHRKCWLPWQIKIQVGGVVPARPWRLGQIHRRAPRAVAPWHRVTRTGWFVWDLGAHDWREAVLVRCRDGVGASVLSAGAHGEAWGSTLEVAWWSSLRAVCSWSRCLDLLL